MTDNATLAVVALFIIVILALVVVGPFFTIWSLNTLFSLEIPYSFSTWIAVNWLLFLLHGVKVQKKSGSNNA
jgi:hypothetical protein